MNLMSLLGVDELTLNPSPPKADGLAVSWSESIQVLLYILREKNCVLWTDTENW